MQFAIDHAGAKVVAALLWQQVAAVGGSVEQQVVGRGFHRAIQHGFQRLVGVVACFKGQVVAEQQEAPGLVGYLGHHRRQVHQVLLVDLDQAQPLVRPGGQQRPHQRRLACPPRAPKQRVIGRQTLDELLGIGGQQGFLPVYTDQIIQPMPGGDRQRLEPPPIPLPHPTRSRGDLPIDHRRHRRQALLVSVEKGNDTLHEIGVGDVGHG